MHGCFCDRLILVRTFPTMIPGSIPTACNASGMGRRMPVIIMLQNKKDADSDEIRTREGNPSRIGCKT